MERWVDRIVRIPMYCKHCILGSKIKTRLRVPGSWPSLALVDEFTQPRRQPLNLNLEFNVNIQDDPSRSSKPIVDIDVKVAF